MPALLVGLCVRANEPLSQSHCDRVKGILDRPEIVVRAGGLLPLPIPYHYQSHYHYYYYFLPKLLLLLQLLQLLLVLRLTTEHTQN